MKTGVYVITNKVDGKRYFGSTSNFDDRWYEHKYALNNNNHDNKHLQNAWNRDGIDAFDFSIIYNCPENECLYWEQILLDMWWDGSNQCYNIAKDACAPMKGRTATQETREKMRKSQTERLKSTEMREQISRAVSGTQNPFYGKKHTQETKENWSKLRKGKSQPPFSDEHRKKLSKSLSGEKNPNYGKKQSPETIHKRVMANTGKKRTQETRNKMSAAHKGKIITQEARDKQSAAMTGRLMAQETKDKIAAANRGKRKVVYVVKCCACGCGMTFEDMPSSNKKYINATHYHSHKKVKNAQ